MRRTLSRAAALAATALLSTVIAAPAQAHSGPSAGAAFGTPAGATTKAPYRPLQSVRSLQQAPAGYTAVFTENVSRHGARALSDSEDGDLLLKLWQQAADEHALTRLGRGFGPDVQELLDANAKVGYGALTGQGRQALQDTAERMEQRLPGLFHRISAGAADPAGRDRIDVVSSGQPRAVDSGTEFTKGLVEGDPALAAAVDPARTDTALLYFHKSAANKDYTDYVKKDPALAATLTAIRDQPRSHQEARRVLERIFTGPFVDRLAAGGYPFAGTEVDVAQAVFNLYSVTADLTEEGDWHFGRYIGSDQAAWFGYLDNAEEFYAKGPGFAGRDITYRMAGVLLDDLFRKVEEKRAGTGTLAAELRFTHAEEIIPLAALMQLPGSTAQATEAAPYTYADNAWRGATVAPMGANIQWDLYRKGNKYLVRMLYNEKQTAFKPGCEPVSKGSYFYELDELERCFGRPAQAH
ncbi:histidine-type phosphatase [Kitasatospora sp. NPDC057015]|uniref:histidine-type phosphatase n=1 Tax=Kitasatospora sp. NPDC057015 TaxID=3346001 RepID=UPI00363297BF